MRVDRNELSGAFGDIGTDLPLIIGMILTAGLHPASVLTTFGLLLIAAALFYRIPMPVQPLKAVAALVIAGGVTGSTIYGAGLAIGLTMLALTATGLLDRFARVIPKTVVRGIQFGLGAKLSLIALTRFVPADGPQGLVLAIISFAVVVSLFGNRKYPPALFVIGIGLLYAFVFRLEVPGLRSSIGFALPRIPRFGTSDVLQGFLILAIPQIPLSLGNSIIATKQIAKDLFPREEITIRKIGFTYSILNILAPFVGGIPVCHGSGGIAGCHAFGARTSASVAIYGSLFVLLGLFFSAGFRDIVRIFPLPTLGILLLSQGLVLMRLVGKTAGSKSDLSIAILVGLLAAGLPYGFLIAIVVGTAAVHLLKRLPRTPERPEAPATVPVYVTRAETDDI